MDHRSRIILICAVVIGTSIWGQAPAQPDERANERLAKHAGLFNGFELKRRVEDIKPDAAGVIDLTPTVIRDYAGRTEPYTAQDELREQARLSDAVVEGTAVRQYSALTPGHSFLYSDWIFKIAAVFKGTSLVPFRVGDEITVARTGGDLILNGQHIVARDTSFPDFFVGHVYALYLMAHFESSSFIVFSGGAFDVTGPKPVPLLDPGNHVTGLREFCKSVSSADLLTEIEGSSKQ